MLMCERFLGYRGQEEKGTTEDEVAGWHHRLNGREFEWTPGDGDGQGGLTCCDSWGHKLSDTTEQLNWTELMAPWGQTCKKTWSWWWGSGGQQWWPIAMVGKHKCQNAIKCIHFSGDANLDWSVQRTGWLKILTQGCISQTRYQS